MSLETVTVSASALRAVLSALAGPPHHIREIQHLRDFDKKMGNINPITQLIEEFNDQIATPERCDKTEDMFRGEK